MAVCCCSAAARARQGLPTGTIAVSYDNGVYSLTLPPGARPRFVTAGHHPGWSRDGRWLAYDSTRTIWRRRSLPRAVSRQVVVPAPGVDDSYPSWAPSSDEIAFTRVIDRVAGRSRILICVAKPGYKHVQALTNGRTPDWSSDGTTIVFARDDGLWTIRRDGSRPRHLGATGPGAQVPRWSPTGRRIAYIDTQAGRSGAGIRVLDPVTGRNALLTTIPISTTTLAWSPDGRWLAFAIDHKVQQGPYLADVFDLVIRNLDDGRQETLLRGRSELDGVAWRTL